MKHSIHEVLAEGTFGVLRFEIENAPMHLSSRGALLIAMSVVHTLQQRYDEASRIYEFMEFTWPHEKKIKALREIMETWNKKDVDDHGYSTLL